MSLRGGLIHVGCTTVYFKSKGMIPLSVGGKKNHIKKSEVKGISEFYLYGIILAIVCTVLPSYMINEAIVRIGATRTTVIGTVGPVLTMLLAISVLGEPSSLQHFLGMAIAVAGVSLVTVR